MRKGRRRRRPLRQLRQQAEHRINNNIRKSPIRLVEVDGLNLNSVVQTTVALKLAEEKGLDLVEISPNADPPIVKIIDYQKFMFDLRKKRKEQKASQPSSSIKELRFGPNIGEHDLETKLEKAKEFIRGGNKLKTFVQFRGRNIVYKDRGREVLQEIAQRLSNIAKVESRPQMFGRRMVMMLSPEE